MNRDGFWGGTMLTSSVRYRAHHSNIDERLIIKGTMRTELAGPEDTRPLVDLFNLVFGASRDLDAWRKIYGATPAGKPVSFIVRTSEGKIIGHLGAIPTIYRRRRQAARGTLLVDFMVHPDWAGRGVGSSMEAAAHEILRDEYDFSFGFSNRNSVSVSSKVGMSNLGRIPVYLRLPRYGFVRRLRKVLPYAGKKLMISAGAGHDGFADATMSPDGIMRLTRVYDLDALGDVLESGPSESSLWHRSRDLPTLKWRYSDRPQGPYAFFALELKGRAAGYLVLARRNILGRDAGVVVDLYMDHAKRETTRFMLTSAVELLSRQGAGVIVFMYRGEREIASSLAGSGFLRVPQRIIPSQLTLNLKAYDDLGGSISENPEDWCLTWSDTDLV